MAYIANTPDDAREMLSAIGLDSVDQLFRHDSSGAPLEDAAAGSPAA